MATYKWSTRPANALPAAETTALAHVLHMPTSGDKPVAYSMMAPTYSPKEGIYFAVAQGGSAEHYFALSPNSISCELGTGVWLQNRSCSSTLSTCWNSGVVMQVGANALGCYSGNTVQRPTTSTDLDCSSAHDDMSGSSSTPSTIASVDGMSISGASCASPVFNGGHDAQLQAMSQTCAAGLGPPLACAGLPYTGSQLSMVECFYALAKLQDSSAYTLKMLLRAVIFLRSCEYNLQDICVIFAYASIYFIEVAEALDHKLTSNDSCHIIILLLFIAHSYALDETCPLKYWHEYLLRDYCDLRSCNDALMGVMRLRGHVLRVDETEMRRRYQQLVNHMGNRSSTNQSL